jgi:ubiquinone/menaquinone biosynthesis C-methylase UbiE
MSKELIADVFNRSAGTYDSVGVKFFTHFGLKLVEKLNPLPGAKILDIGCGKGATLIPSAKAVGPDGFVEGIDISKGMLDELNKILEKENITNTRTLLMDAEDVSFEVNSFDYITGSFVLFFLTDPINTLFKLKTNLKENGQVCFSTFKKGSSLEWLMELVLKYLPDLKENQKNQENFDTEKSLVGIFTESGFKNIDVEELSHTFVYKDEQQWFEELWSHGYRYALESMSDENLASFKIECVERLNAFRKEDGFHIPISVLFTFAVK